jgi:hypothetical protein
VKAGYASTLVTRSRGQAPLLLPVTPSRFEPDSHVADLHDDVTVGEPADATPDHGADTPPLLVRQSGPGSVTGDDFLATAMGSNSSPSRDEQRNGDGRLPTPAPAEPASEPVVPLGRAPMPDAAPAQLPAQPIGLGEKLWTTAPSRATPDPTGLVEQIVATRRPDHDDRSAARSARLADRAEGEPPIVVRIGRVDVRAVQAPPAPRTDPGPRRPAGPTLEERLAARDRQ